MGRVFISTVDYSQYSTPAANDSSGEVREFPPPDIRYFLRSPVPESPECGPVMREPRQALKPLVIIRF
jgi:hypothetical protein